MALWTMAVIKTCIVKKNRSGMRLESILKRKSILLIILNFTK